MKLDALIDFHIQFYQNEEKRDFDKARRLYRGRAWSGAGAPQGDAARSMLASKNMVYAIADTAVSSLLGPNPRITCSPRNRAAERAKPAVNGLMDYIFDRNRIRSRAGIALVDSILCGRGIFKTGWNRKQDIPWVREVDPSRLFFDLSVRNVEDITYWTESTPLRVSEFAARVRAGKYKLPKSANIEASVFPSWLEAAGESNRNQLRNSHKWVPIYEHYDVTRGKVYHFHRETGTVLMERDIQYIPYSMFFLNHNSVDCRGLAEVQLILPQQQTINELLTLLKQVTYLQIPRILYDAGQIGEKDLSRILSATTGAFIGVDPENSEALRSLSQLFYPMPTPENPPDVKSFLDMMTEDTAFISALAEMARGQTTGARTATEMALVDAQMRNRLGTREGHFHSAVSDMARKAFYLARRRMSGAHTVRVTGEAAWVNVSHEQLRDVEADFSVSTYNPIQHNPGVLAETLVQLQPMLEANPYVKLRELTAAIYEGLGLPETALKTEAEVQKEAEEAMAAEAAAAGGAPAMPPGGGGGAPALPPEVEAALAAEQGGGPAAMGAPVPAPAAVIEETDPQTGLPIGRDPTEEELLMALANGADGGGALSVPGLQQ